MHSWENELVKYPTFCLDSRHPSSNFLILNAFIPCLSSMYILCQQMNWCLDTELPPSKGPGSSFLHHMHPTWIHQWRIGTSKFLQAPCTNLLGCCQNRAFFFAGYFELSHTHRVRILYCCGVLYRHFVGHLKEHGSTYGFYFVFSISLSICGLIMKSKISSYWCMEFHGCPPIFPSFFGGLAMLYQFPPKVLKPSEELGLPVAPWRHPQRTRCGSPKVFFLGWGGATQIFGRFSLSLSLGVFWCFFVVGSQNSWCWSLNGWLLDVVGSGLMSPPAQGWEPWKS